MAESRMVHTFFTKPGDALVEFSEYVKAGRSAGSFTGAIGVRAKGLKEKAGIEISTGLTSVEAHAMARTLAEFVANPAIEKMRREFVRQVDGKKIFTLVEKWVKYDQAQPPNVVEWGFGLAVTREGSSREQVDRIAVRIEKNDEVHYFIDFLKQLAVKTAWSSFEKPAGQQPKDAFAPSGAR